LQQQQIQSATHCIGVLLCEPSHVLFVPVTVFITSPLKALPAVGFVDVAASAAAAAAGVLLQQRDLGVLPWCCCCCYCSFLAWMHFCGLVFVRVLAHSQGL
jgi:hypothetical protein